MAGERKITVTFDGKDVGLKKAADDAVDTVQKSGDGIGNAFKDVGKIAGGFLVAELTTQLADWGKQGLSWLWDGTELASDTRESMSKVDTVFGDSAVAIRDFSKNAAQNLGLSERAALDAAGGFGNMFTQLGFTTDNASAASQEMLGLAADLASFHNADITDVIEAQTSAFRGEYDSLQKYIPTINAAAVEQEALNLTGLETADQLTAQDKAWAAEILMMQGAGAASGDFARTQDGVANQQRIAAAETENLQASLGEKLLPITEKVTAAKRKLVEILANDVVPWVTETGAKIQEKLQPVWQWFMDNKDDIWGAFEDIGNAISEDLGPALSDLIDAGKEVTEDIDWQAVWTDLEPVLRQVGAVMSDTVVLIITTIAMLVSNTAQAIQEMKEQWDKHKAIRDTVREVWDWVYTKISTSLSLIQGIIRLVTSIIQGDWSGAWKAVKQIAGAIWDSIGADFRAFTAPIRSAASTVWNGLSSGLQTVVDSVERNLNRLISVYNNTVGRIPGVGDIKPIGSTSGLRKTSSTIPKFHTGGTYKAPPGMSEGLAVLSDGENVSMPGQGGSFGGDAVMHITADDSETAQFLLNLLRRAAAVNGLKVSFG